MTLTEVRELLARLEIRPSKALGQNFLVDGNILRILVEQADLRHDETVLEIGPGLGALTVELIARARQVVAIEKDPRLCQYLREHVDGINLIEGDAVDVLERPDFQIAAPYKVVSNLPYSLSTPILERLVERADKPRAMILTVQREVAHRLAATPRHKDYGALTVFTQLCYHVTIAHIISPRCFFPAPQVDSAITVLERRDPRVKLAEKAPFHDVVRAGFSQRRKMLHKLLAPFGAVDRAFTAASVAPTARAEELALEQWITLANAFGPRS
ncbi:MAG TPA: 16S rRNA (adenine(1518)-N(6)/adenine(1519)-N(6))-dimethyltransferase RsmA [Verrucomicrobiae bacterium]|nr:16S rRNA (adenine(1518)-N(6)/adenine(1519)-N(6))-dimethyltransferase RsmA [Verrucomicrobiae bacterium]